MASVNRNLAVPRTSMNAQVRKGLEKWSKFMEAEMDYMSKNLALYNECDMKDMIEAKKWIDGLPKLLQRQF